MDNLCALCKCQPIISLILVTHVTAIAARGPQELGGPGSLNRLNPRFLRHWQKQTLFSSLWHYELGKVPRQIKPVQLAFGCTIISSPTYNNHHYSPQYGSTKTIQYKS